MKKSDKIIKQCFEKTGSVKGASKETGYSWNKIVKSLSSNGVTINYTHYQIMQLHEKGLSVDQIAKQVGVNVKTVQAYLPRVRPVYAEDRSKNALAIKKWRERKKAPEQ